MSITSPIAVANQLRKNGQFAEALAIYETHWNDESLPRYEWDTWSYAFCLRKTERYTELLDFCRKAYFSYPTFEALNTLYAWAIYYTAVKNAKLQTANGSDTDLLKAAKGVLRLTTQANQYAPYTLVVMKVLDVLASKPKFPAATVLEWSSLLDPSLLDVTPSCFVDAKGKTVAIASKCEQFFSVRIKVLHLAGQHDACLATVDQALAWLPKLHYGNEHWWHRYAALSHAALGDFAKAIALLEGIWAQRKEWFVAADLATVLLNSADAFVNYKRATTYLHEAALAFGDMEKKVKVYKLLAKTYTLLGEVDLAMEHYELVALIRSDFDWSADLEVSVILAEGGIVAGRFGSSVAMFGRLKLVWEAAKAEASPRISGMVTKLLPNGKSGFVKSVTDGQSYFFQLKNVRNLKGKTIVEGMALSFVLEAGFDVKKQVAVQNATKLILVQM
jgi:tetratricopeptide (TPR) repeat protein